jgi:D-lyxose ketol-isomerase
MSSESVTRRRLLQAAALGAGLAATGRTAGGRAAAAGPGAPDRPGGKTVPAIRNADFYGADGKFLGDKAKQAYYDMMRRFDYPVPDRLKGQDFWALDFGLGDFAGVGMAGIFWWNSQKYGYFGHEIYLLPGQMIVEHAHVATEAGPAKMEAWHVRHGMIWTLGEGEETRPMPVRLPESQARFITVRHAEPLKPGEVRELNRPTARHFMVAGPEGAIVTEYATYHDGAGLRFTNPGVKF